MSKTFNQLNESTRIEFLKDQFRSKFPPETFERIFHAATTADPTAAKEYLQWILKMLATDGAQISDLDKIHQYLSVFHKIKRELQPRNRDINSYKIYQDLYTAIKPHLEYKSQRQIEREQIAEWKKSITTIYDGPLGLICIPHSVEASCFLGRGTQWCTAADKNNYFNRYNNSGPLVIFIPSDGYKMQMHLKAAYNVDPLDLYHKSPTALFNAATSQGPEFMNAEDRPVRQDVLAKYIDLVSVLASNRQYSNFFMLMALRTHNATLFNITKSSHRQFVELLRNDAKIVLERWFTMLTSTTYKAPADFVRMIEMLKMVVDN